MNYNLKKSLPGEKIESTSPCFQSLRRRVLYGPLHDDTRRAKQIKSVHTV